MVIHFAVRKDNSAISDQSFLDGVKVQVAYSAPSFRKGLLL